MKRRAIAFALAAAAAAAASTAAAQRPRPVMIGSDDPDAPACGIGEVSGLNPGGDNYLSVRAGPSVRARELERLRSGRRVYVCDHSADWRWRGVVYGPERTSDCGVSSPVSRPQPYQTRWHCRSGWVAARYIMITD